MSDKFLLAMALIAFFVQSAYSQKIPPDYLDKPIHVKSKFSSKEGITFTNENITYLRKDFDKNFYDKLVKKIGWVYQPNSINRQIVSIENTNQKFDAIYRLDELSRRINPPTATNYKTHLILAGDSNTFGVGLNDHETLAQVVEKKLKNVRVYNYGHGGGGPHNTLAFLSFFKWDEHIKEKEGKMFYVFYPEWMAHRVVGAKNYLSWDLAKSPWFELEKDDQLVYRGSFRDRWITYWFYKFITKIDVFNLVGDLPRIGTRHMKLISKIFKEMEKEYLKKFPNGQFVVVLSEYILSNPRHVRDLEKFLKEDRVNYVIINNLVRYKIDKYHLIDSHFNYQGANYIYEEMKNANLFIYNQ